MSALVSVMVEKSLIYRTLPMRSKFRKLIWLGSIADKMHVVDIKIIDCTDLMHLIMSL